MKNLIHICPLVFAAACTTPYAIPPNAIANPILVVDGAVYASGDSSVIRLTRSAPLGDTFVIPFEAGAHVLLKTPGGGPSYSFRETDSGYYTLPAQNLDRSLTYRLNITLAGGQQYLSDYVPVVPTPTIDSISWQQAPGAGVTIYANTHDPTNSIHYYMWTYVETYEYRSYYTSKFIFENDTPVNICYISYPSTNLLLASTAALSNDVVYHAPLEIIPYRSIKLCWKYTTIVTQTALTQGGYTYWQNMQANSEDLGSIFGPQPFQPAGNIHSVSNPGETVAGYLTVTTPQVVRIWITNAQLNDWTLPNPGCPYDTMTLADQNNPGWVPIDSANHKYLGTFAGCGDCRFDGGKVAPPTFWQ